MNKYSIAGNQELIRKIYGDRNQEMSRHRLVECYFRRMSVVARGICKVRRTGKQELENASEKICRSLAWLFAIANQFEIDVRESFIRKFPDHCPYCLQQVCRCDQTGQTPFYAELDSLPRRLAELKRLFDVYQAKSVDMSLDSAVDSIATLYPTNAALWAPIPERMFQKIFEEIGELSIAIEMYFSDEGQRYRAERVSDIQDEIADNFAWICGLWGVFHHVTVGNRKKRADYVSFSETFESLYKSGCPDCHGAVCKCKSSPEDRSSGPSVKDLIAMRDELRGALPTVKLEDSKVKVQELIKMIEMVIETPRAHIRKSIPLKVSDVLNAAIGDKKFKSDRSLLDHLAASVRKINNPLDERS